MKLKYKVIFSKTKEMVYISHLDLMTLFRRAVRRADLPFVLSEGFTPRVKISMPSALKLGAESFSEEMFLWLSRPVRPENIRASLGRQLPEGIGIQEVNIQG